MKVTRNQLQNYFTAPLPDVQAIADAFTFHAFEIDGIEGDELDIKVLPNRAPDCSTAEGIARELAAILNVSLKEVPTFSYLGAPVVASLADINNILGAEFTAAEVEDVFRRLYFKVEKHGEKYLVQAPAPRTDMEFSADIAEEIGRILGYDRLESKDLPPATEHATQSRYRGIEKMKDQLVAQGFTEVSTQSFAKAGKVELANPLDKTRPYLRVSLEAGLADALAKAKLYAPLVLAPNEKPKLFEVGSVFDGNDEHIELRMTEKVSAWGEMTVDNLSVAKLEEDGAGYEPVRVELTAYHPFSTYPFTTRDIAAWVPTGTDEEGVSALIKREAGALAVRVSFVDRFEKEGRVSLAFRIVFNSMERTLTDDEVNAAMTNVSAAFAKAGYEVR